MEASKCRLEMLRFQNSPASVPMGSQKRHPSGFVSSLVTAVLASTSLHANAAMAASSMMQFEIKDVGRGNFANAVVATDPGKGDTPSGRLCLTLEGGSRDNDAALLSWLSSNSSGAALASKPDAILIVTANRSGLRKGEYHLSKITVDDYIKKADRDLSHPRVDSIKVKCEFLQEPPSSEAAANSK